MLAVHFENLQLLSCYTIIHMLILLFKMNLFINIFIFDMNLFTNIFIFDVHNFKNNLIMKQYN